MRATLARATALAALFALSACDNKGTLVVVTVDSTTALPTAASLDIGASAGGRTRQYNIPLTPAGVPPARSIGIDVPPSVSGSFSVVVDARDESGTVLATGGGQTTIEKGKRVDIAVDLTGGGGTDDLGDVDMTVEPDMTVTGIGLTSPSPYVMVRAGGTFDVPLTLTRGPGVTGDVTVTPSGLPSMVTAAPITILAADTQGVITLNAGAAAAQGGPTMVTLTGSNGTVMGTLTLGVNVAGPAGSRDNSFNSNGAAIVDFPTARYDTCSAVTVTPTLSPVVATATADPSMLSVYDIGAAQLTLAGALDSTFGTAGIRRVHAADTEALRAVLAQPDGKILLVGAAQINSGNYDVLVIRLNKNGSVDGTFGSAGIVTVDMGGNSDFGQAVALQPDGKIVIAGGQSVAPAAAFVLRLNTNGSPDTTFGNMGKLVLPALGTAGYDYLNGVAIRKQDGKIIVGGYTSDGSFASTTEDAVVARITTAGALDTTFGTNGKTIVNGSYGGSDKINSIALGANDVIFAGGHGQIPYMSTNQQDFCVYKFTADGAVDSTFGPYGGRQYVDWNHLNDEGYGVAVQPDGKVVIVGTARQAMGQNNGIARMDGVGNYDTGFGTGGKVEIDLKTNLFDGALAVAIAADGRIVVGGYIDDSNGSNNNYDCTVIRLWP